MTDTHDTPQIVCNIPTDLYRLLDFTNLNCFGEEQGCVRRITCFYHVLIKNQNHVSVYYAYNIFFGAISFS